MKFNLTIEKSGVALYEGTFDISDADSLGAACAHAWNQLREHRMAAATSIGALYEELDSRILNELDGAQISLSRA